MSQIINICNSSSVLQVFLIIKTILKLACYLTPFIIIIVSFINIFKTISTGNKDDLKEYWVIFVKRIIAGLVVFFIPAIITACMNIIDDSHKMDFLVCLETASQEKVAELKEKEEQEEAVKRAIQEEEDERLLEENAKYDAQVRERNRKIFEESLINRNKLSSSKLDYSTAVEVPDSILYHAKHSDLSVVIVDESGKVIASRNPYSLREGGSTAKIFTGYAAVKLLDLNNDRVYNTKYAQNMPYMGTPDVKVGSSFSVAEAATRDFPGSSNITTANIAIAIGKKLHNSPNDKQAYFDGMDEINKLIKEAGCNNTKLASSNGVNYNYKTNKFLGNKNSYATGEYGISANDLALITIKAMQEESFANGINYGKNGICPSTNKNSFFIKSGTQAYCHGVWGFNHNGKRYYVVIIGVNCNKGDNKCSTYNDIYEWAIRNIIK